MTLHLLLIGGVAAALLCTVLTGLMLWSGLAWRVVDTPNERSSHTRPTPRIGGAILMVSAFAVLAFLPVGVLWPALIPAAALAVLSFWDDVRSLTARTRFGGHLLAAIAVVLLYPVQPLWLAVPLVLFLIWLTNLYNFMDGIDGIAGGMALFGFGAYAAAAWIGGNAPLALVAMVLTGAAIGFLIFNFAPARIFMGDAGAIPLGFLAALLGYLGYREGTWPWWFALLVFSPFIVDATITLLRRLQAGEKVWAAHRSYYYQRMSQSSFGHRGTTLCWYLLMAAAAGSALWLRTASFMIVGAAALTWITVYLVLLLWIDRRWPRHTVRLVRGAEIVD